MEESIMASISLLNSNSLSGTMQSNGTTTAAKTSGQPKTANTTATHKSQGDTVTLSEAAQARLMRAQGKSVSNIASSLGTSTKEIDNDLGITVEEALEKAIQQTESAAK
jgi:hypothetical protein